MTNNLMRIELAPGQTTNQYATVNTSDGRIDGAITAELDVLIGTLGTYTITADDLTKHFEFVLVNAGSPPVANFAVVLAQDDRRGLVIVTNKTAFSASVTTTGQTLPAVVIAAGGSNLIAITDTDAYSLGGGVGGGSIFVLKAGDTMTGPLLVPVGSVGAPGLAFAGDPDTGFYDTPGGGVFLGIDGVQNVWFHPTGLIISHGGGAQSASFTLASDFFTAFSQTYHASNNAASSYFIRKSRGTLAIPTVVAANDFIMTLTAQAYGNTAFKSVGYFTFQVIAATPSDTDMLSRWSLFLNVSGSVIPAETLRAEQTTGFSMFGANVVIDQNRNHRLRSYTIATLPPNIAGLELYCSDTGGGGSELVGDGTNWKRSNIGEQTVATDAINTLTWLTSAQFQKHTGVLTANRAWTLATMNASAGSWFEVSVTGAHAFALTFSGLINLPTGTWARFVYDGAAWYVSAHGYLDTPTNIGFFYPGVPPVSSKIWGMVTTFPFTLADQYAGSQGYADTAPGATITFDVKKNGTNIGTMVFTSANTATFTNIAAGADSFAIGDRLSVHTPASVSTLADLQVMFKGIRVD